MAISWILYTDAVVGQGHPSLADIANRPLRNILTDSGYAPDGSDWAGFAKSTHQHAASDITSGILSVPRGGTGVASVAAGNLLLGAVAAAMVALAPGASGGYVRSDGSTWARASGVAVGDLSGTVAATQGGTGLTTYVAGDILYSPSTNTVGKLPIDAAGKVLRSDGALPAWSTSTFADTYSQGALLYGSAANTVTGLAVGTSNQVLTSNGTIPTWSSSLSVTGLTLTGAGQVITATAGNTNAHYQRWTSTGGDFYLGIQNSAGNFFTGPAAYTTVLYSPNNNVVIVSPGGTTLTVGSGVAFGGSALSGITTLTTSGAVLTTNGNLTMTRTGGAQATFTISRTGASAVDWSAYIPAGSTELRFLDSITSTDRFSLTTGGVGTFAAAISVGSTVASAGNVRLPNDTAISWRNAANDGNLSLQVNGANAFTFNSAVVLGITDLSATGLVTLTANAAILAGSATGSNVITMRASNGSVLSRYQQSDGTNRWGITLASGTDYTIFDLQNSVSALTFVAGAGTTGVATFIGKVKVGTEIEIDGALNHDGTTVGFYGATPTTQGAAVADASGGATIDAEARTAINSLLARVRSTGLIAT